MAKRHKAKSRTTPAQLEKMASTFKPGPVIEAIKKLKKPRTGGGKAG